MFWKFNQSSPQIDTILAKEDLTLDELFEQESLLQELKSQNQKLIEFMIRREVLDQLVSSIIEEPSNELSDAEKYKRANLSCEVLTTDIPRVNESLANEGLLTKMFSFLEKEPPLNPLLASFFSRTLSLLICRKADQHWYSYQFTCLSVLDFFKTRNHSLNLLLKHLGTSAIMDLTLKLVTQIEGEEMQQNLNDWLESERFLGNVIDLFIPSVDSDRHYNAAQLLCQIIRKCRETSINKPDPLLSYLQSGETIQTLLKHMLSEESVSESSVNCGIIVLLTLLEDPIPETAGRRGPYYDESISSDSNQPIVNPALPTIVSAIIPSLPKFHDLLINPPKKNPVKLACGTIDPPLGTVRLSVIKLMSALIATNTREVNEMLDSLNVIQVLLDLFFQYTWNNFLHTQVDKCLAFAMNSPVNELTENNPLLINIFVKCCLIHRILGAWKDNHNEESKEGGKRRGYMGHLTNIANSILKQSEGSLGAFLKQHLDEETLTMWQEFIENSLTPINELHGRVLGGRHPGHTSNEETNSEFTTVPYSNGPFEQNENDISFGYGASEMEEDEADDFGNSSFLESRIRSDVLDRVVAEDWDDELPPPKYKSSTEVDDSYYKTNSSPWDDCAITDDTEESWANFDTASFENQFAQNVSIDVTASGEETSIEEPSEASNVAVLARPSSSEDTSAITTTDATVTQPFPPPLESEKMPENDDDKEGVKISNQVAVTLPTVEADCSGSKHEELLEVRTATQSAEVETIENDNKLLVNDTGDNITFPESELADNFRFLSKQGMITNTDSSKTEDGTATFKKDERTCEEPREVPKPVGVEAAPNPV